jgi:glycine oxidase
VSDVLILGGGVIGCAVAFELSRRGASVTVADTRELGGGASQASAGMLAPHHEGRHDPVLESLGVASLARYDEWASLLDAERIGYSRAGSIEVAVDAAGEEQLHSLAESLTRREVAHEWLGPIELRSMEPGLTPGARAGLSIPAHGIVDVRRLVSALWERAAAHGARRLDAAAIQVSPGHGTVRVDTTRGPVDTPHVVLAAGSWAGRVDVVGTPALPVRPVRGQLLVLQREGLLTQRAIWGPRAYVVPQVDGALLVGATVEEAGFDERPTATGVQALLEGVCELVPDAAAATFGGVRVGLRPGTPDDRPIIGRSSIVDGLLYATGHFRNGALLAPLTGKLVADLVEGRDDPALAPLGPHRFDGSRLLEPASS